MGKIAGMICINSKCSEDKLKTMLDFSSPQLATVSENTISTYYFENLAFGLTTGSFATNKEKTISCAFSGQLLRKEKLLEAMKKDKKSYFDSEADLLIAAFEILKTSLFCHLDGDFSFVLFDETKKELYVARDRMGGHDLFWCSNQNAILFGSSLKALLSTGYVSASPSNEALASYLALGYISQDKSPIEGVNRLLPGYYMKIGLDGKLSISSYWSYSGAFKSKKKRTFASSQELFSELQEHIFRAVQCRVYPDLPCGAVTTTTIASSFIQEILFTTLKQPIPALSVQYDHPSEARELLKNEHHAKIDITHEHFLQNIVPMIWSMETPVVDYDHLASFEFANWCQVHNLTPFFDTGFDQEFFDYSSPVIKHVLAESHKPSALTNLFHGFNKKISWLLSRTLPSFALKNLRKALGKDPRIGFLERQGFLTQQELLKASPSLGKLFQSDLFLHEFYHLPRIESEAASLFYLTMKTEVIDKLHTMRYKFAIDHGTTPQAPFLDLELLEFLASLDDSIWASPDMLASFPSSLLEEEYQTIPTFSHADFHTLLEHPQISMIFRSLRAGLLVESGLISRDFLDDVLNKKRPGYGIILYQILVLELWMRLYIDLPLSLDNGKLSLNDLLLNPSIL
jgi:asparagine synthase (glutamine-hydrolysing)